MVTIRTLLLLAAGAIASPVGIAIAPANHTIDRRDYPVSCGWQNLYPCAAGLTCYTSNNQPYCSGGTQAAATVAANADYEMFTTTYTTSETLTITSTYSSALGGSTGGTCAAGSHQCTPTLCCAADQWCDSTSGTCKAYAAGNSPGGSAGVPAATLSVTTMTVSGTATTISNFIAPTSVSITTITSSGTATTTEAFSTPIGVNGSPLSTVTAQAQSSGGGLSGGAIAGIVIGVLVGLFILFIILACLCCKSIFDLIFGKKERKETTTYVQTHHSAHGSASNRPPPPRRFFGILPPRQDRPNRPEKKSSNTGLWAVLGGLTALAVLLGLKRRDDRRREEEKSEYTVSDDYYSDYYTETSASSASSDRRTRNTHASASRHSRR